MDTMANTSEQTPTVSLKIAKTLDFIGVFDVFGLVHLQVEVDGCIKTYILKNNQPTPFQEEKNRKHLTTLLFLPSIFFKKKQQQIPGHFHFPSFRQLRPDPFKANGSSSKISTKDSNNKS